MRCIPFTLTFFSTSVNQDSAYHSSSLSINNIKIHFSVFICIIIIKSLCMNYYLDTTTRCIPTESAPMPSSYHLLSSKCDTSFSLITANFDFTTITHCPYNNTSSETLSRGSCTSTNFKHNSFLLPRCSCIS